VPAVFHMPLTPTTGPKFIGSRGQARPINRGWPFSAVLGHLLEANRTATLANRSGVSSGPRPAGAPLRPSALHPGPSVRAAAPAAMPMPLLRPAKPRPLLEPARRCEHARTACGRYRRACRPPRPAIRRSRMDTHGTAPLTPVGREIEAPAAKRRAAPRSSISSRRTRAR
jgi:hypothetical protein